MSDKICKIGKSTIQHGRASDRIYLMKLHESDYPAIIEKLDHLASENEYTKVFAKVPTRFVEEFTQTGYGIEASIPRFYKGKDDAAFLGKYYSEERARQAHEETIEKNIELAKSIEPECKSADGFEIEPATENSVEEMTTVYKKVFETYPFPIHDAEYIKKTMADNIMYFCARDAETGELAAIASAEMDKKNENVEMTDFATLPKYRGRGLANALLAAMEDAMRKTNMKCSYTIARAMSAGMNIVFAKHGYRYSGTLVNNTDICGNLESMNIWYKML